MNESIIINCYANNKDKINFIKNSDGSIMIMADEDLYNVCVFISADDKHKLIKFLSEES